MMASGMGIRPSPSTPTGSTPHYGVENIIRVGSAGAMRRGHGARQRVCGVGACTNSSFADQYELGATCAPICNYDLLAAAVESAGERA